MITFDTNKARFLVNMRTCDAIPIVATVTNIAHLIFKTATFFKGPQVEPSLYSKFVTQGSTLEFIVRAIPVVGQIFSAAQHLYYQRKSTKELLTPSIHVMTNRLADSYLTAKINSGDKKVFAEESFRFVTPQKFEITVLRLLNENKWEEILSLIKNCDSSLLMTDFLMSSISNEMRCLETSPGYDHRYEEPISEIKYLYHIAPTWSEVDTLYKAVRDLG